MSTQNTIIDEILFNGGLDADSDLKFVKQGDYIDAYNITVNEDGNRGVIINMKGNESVYTPNQDYIWRMCGWAFYNKNESIVLFLWGVYSNPPFNHKNLIVEYNPEQGVGTTIIDNTLLGFLNPVSNDYFIKADMLGDWLAWTDNIAEVCMINIKDVKDSTFTITDKFDISLIRKSPMLPPTLSIGFDSSIKSDNIDKPFQFKYNYIYSDYRHSTYSSGSDIVINRSLLIVDNDYTDKTLYNYVDVKFYSGDDNVSYCNIIARVGNNGTWSKVITIDKSDPENCHNGNGTYLTTLSDNTYYYYRFFNNRSFVGIDDALANKAYDYIPEKSETLSFTSDNRLCLAGNTSGKDIPELNVTLSAGYESDAYNRDWSISEVTRNSASYPILSIAFDLSDINVSHVLKGDYVHFDWSVQQDYDSTVPITITATFSLDEQIQFDDDYSTSADIAEYIADNVSDPSVSGITVNNGSWNIYHSTSQIVFAYTIVDPVYTFNGTETIVTDDSILYTTYITLVNFDTDQAFSALKSHKLGLIYWDEYGRKYPVLTSSDTEIYIESKGDASNSGRAYINFDLSSMTAPSDAVAYRWAYAYQPKLFTQTICCNVTYIKEDGDIKDDILALDVSGRNNMNYNYTIEVGDFIRVLMPGGSYTLPTTYASDVKEFKILDIKYTINDGTSDYSGIWLIIKPSEVDAGYTYATTGVSSKFYNSLLEIYKKQSEQDDVLFYEIGNGGTCSGGSHSPATGKLNEGDVWFRPKTVYYSDASDVNSVVAQNVLIEDMYPYNAYTSSAVGISDVNVEFEDSRSKYDNTILWSNKFFQDTNINGLSTFDYDDKKDISDIYGKIKGLELLGNVLTIICEEKVLTAYVGATEYTDASGNVNVIKSTDPIGYIRPHAENFGTFLKESIVNTGKYIYFFDIFNGVVVRKAYNGLQTISGSVPTQTGVYNYNMRGFFKELSKDLIDSIYTDDSVSYEFYENVKCYMGFDPYNENLYATFVDRTDSNNCISLIFNEPLNKWITMYTAYDTSNNVLATMYPFTKKSLFHFNEGNSQVYKLNSDNVGRCVLYGHEYDSYIQFVSHISPNINKIFNAIGIHSDDEWSNDSMEIDANTSYSNGMYTKVLDSEWIYEEGVQRSDIPRNMKTRSSTASNYDRYNGEEMRGKVLKVKLTNDSTDKVELFKVDVNVKQSR